MSPVSLATISLSPLLGPYLFNPSEHQGAWAQLCSFFVCLVTLSGSFLSVGGWWLHDFYLLTQTSTDCLTGISTWISTWWLYSLTISKTKLLIFFPASQKMAALLCSCPWGTLIGSLSPVSHNTQHTEPQTHWKFNFQSESEVWFPFYLLGVPLPLHWKLQRLLTQVSVFVL